MDSKELLHGVAKEVSACTACALHRMATNPVSGEGNPQADLMFVGEGPGKREDELGRPFVGSAGKLLDELLASIQLTRDDVFIGNVVKHRPPGNRDPLPDEVEACWPFLKRQIDTIQPKVIVLLGRHALDRFLPGKGIRDVHGRALRAGTQVYFPMYHPAAALYGQKLKPVLFEDMAKIPKVLKLIEGGQNVTEEHSSDGQANADSQQGRLV